MKNFLSKRRLFKNGNNNDKANNAGKNETTTKNKKNNVPPSKKEEEEQDDDHTGTTLVSEIQPIRAANNTTTREPKGSTFATTPSGASSDDNDSGTFSIDDDKPAAAETPTFSASNSSSSGTSSVSSSSLSNKSPKQGGEAQEEAVTVVVEEEEAVEVGLNDETEDTKQEEETKGMPRVISKTSLLIENAYLESSGGVGLFDNDSSNKAPKQEEAMERPLDITHMEAMDAAAICIKQRIAECGSISAAESATMLQEKMKVLQLLWRHFPGALSSQQVLDGYKRVVEPRGYTPKNTLFAQSICPDEVNHEQGDITNLFTTYCGEVFHMGGLAGIPFTGKVGFGAFSHHVPEDVHGTGDGHCAVLLAPHIGIDSFGKLGVYTRDGQAHSGSCCGAAVGAYVHCRAAKPVPDLSVNPEFYQFNYIINQVHQNMDRIVGETECAKQASLARFMHETGADLLSKCINTDFGGDKSTLVVLTGIQINMPRPFSDFFLPMDFFIMKKDGTKEDVFEEAFGPKPPKAN